MKKLLLWLCSLLCAPAFAVAAAWLVSGNWRGYFVAPLSAALLFWAALRLRRINLGAPAGGQALAPDYETVVAKIDEIEAEMKRIGMWQAQPLRPEQYTFTRAFAGDTMAFEQWLQFVLIPRVRQIAASRGSFPHASEVAAQAAREFDTCPLDVTRLQTLLYEFDRLFGGRRL